MDKFIGVVILVAAAGLLLGLVNRPTTLTQVDSRASMAAVGATLVPKCQPAGSQPLTGAAWDECRKAVNKYLDLSASTGTTDPEVVNLKSQINQLVNRISDLTSKSN